MTYDISIDEEITIRLWSILSENKKKELNMLNKNMMLTGFGSFSYFVEDFRNNKKMIKHQRNATLNPSQINTKKVSLIKYYFQNL